MKYAYLITVDDHYEGMNYYLCATEVAADKLFKKIIKEKYFDPKKDTKEDLEEACYEWYWESRNGDTVMVSRRQMLF